MTGWGRMPPGEGCFGGSRSPGLALPPLGAGAAPPGHGSSGSLDEMVVLLALVVVVLLVFVWSRPWSMTLPQAYCVKCRATRGMRNPTQVTLKNGRPATQGTCSACGAAVFRFGKAS